MKTMMSNNARETKGVSFIVANADEELKVEPELLNIQQLDLTEETKPLEIQKRPTELAIVVESMEPAVATAASQPKSKEKPTD